MSMKLWNCCVVGVSLLGLCVAPALGAAAEPATSNSQVLKLGDEIVTHDQLTSFGAEIGQLSGGFPPEGKALIDEYVLTRLYDKIPTTASLPVVKAKSSASPYVTTAQRNMLKRAVQEQVLNQTEVPRPELEAWYAKNKSRYQKPERVFAWHIFMETSDDNASSAPAKVRSRLQGVKAKIDGGTSFSQVAKEFSEAASSKSGGQIGYISPRQPIGPLNKPMNPELEDAFFALTPNTVSDVVETSHGMHLLYVTDKDTTRTPTVDDLITSGILPGSLARDLATSRIREMIQETIARHGGKVLPNFSDSDAVSTGTVAFEIDGRVMTVGDLGQIFGERFTGYVESIKDDKTAFRKLMEQGMEDEGLVLTAIDMGVAKRPGMESELNLIGRKVAADEHVQAIVDAETSVSEDAIRARYHKLLDQLRKPEVEGFMVQVEMKQSTETAEQARERNIALKLAENLGEAMQNGSFEAIANQVKNQANDSKTTVIAVSRHVIGHGTSVTENEFDRGVSSVQGDKGVGQPVPMGNKMVVVKIDNRYPGEAAPLDEVHDRIRQMLENEARAELRGQLIERLEKAGLVTFLAGAEEYGWTGDDASEASGTTGTVVNAGETDGR